MLILGLNAFHADSAACIVEDGQLIFAVEEERFRRLKHWAGFPSMAIQACLEAAGVKLDDIDHIAVNQNSGANFRGKVGYLLSGRPSPSLVWDRLANRRARKSLPDLLAQEIYGSKFKGEIHNIEHHIAHLYSAFFVSPFNEATTVSVDGFGDFASAAWGLGRGENISIDNRVYFPHSLGIFYQALTQYIGFPFYGDEYKVMGLAPYGQPNFLKEMRQILSLQSEGLFQLDLKYFRHHREKIAFDWSDGSPEFSELFTPELEVLLGPRRAPADPLDQRHKDIARSTQVMYEEAFFNLMNTLQAKHGVTDVTLAGGCAANSVANGKIRRMTPYKRVYVQSAAGDAGGAIGAAFAVWQKLGGERTFVMDHAYQGPEFNNDYISNLLGKQHSRMQDAGCSVELIENMNDLCRMTATSIADGQVVGWFQGRMEWGPRALGNRSILGDPRRADMKDILNAKIKRRESFRPFAPSVLFDHVANWFEEDDDVPFMMQVFQIREQQRSLIPAVTHVDGSGRLQTVKESANPKYHALISDFYQLTGIPMVLNTSFNENEPVVCKPEEALDCFLRTNMDVLVLGEFFIRRAS